MPTMIQNIAFDCADPYELARFWSAVFEQPVDEDAEPGDSATVVELPEGPMLYFQRVPEAKVIKNRLHICLRPEIRRDDEVARVMALGATMVVDRREPDGSGWAVLADPEGNEFCVLRSRAERANG